MSISTKGISGWVFALVRAKGETNEERRERERERKPQGSKLSRAISLAERSSFGSANARDCRIETGNYVWSSISGVVLPRELVRALAEFAKHREKASRWPASRRDAMRCDSTRLDSARLDRVVAAKSGGVIKVVTTFCLSLSLSLFLSPTLCDAGETVSACNNNDGETASRFRSEMGEISRYLLAAEIHGSWEVAVDAHDCDLLPRRASESLCSQSSRSTRRDIRERYSWILHRRQLYENIETSRRARAYTCCTTFLNREHRVSLRL